MYPNWLGIISAIIAFLAFFLTYRYALTFTVKKRIILSTLAVVAAIPGASFELYYHHFFPETDWYFQFRSITGTELLVIFVGIAGGLIASLLSRVLIIMPLMLVALYSVAPVIKPFVRQIYPEGAIGNNWRDGVCMQSTYATCGPSSVATILKLHGISVTESEMAKEGHSCMSGTEIWYLARSVRSRGLKARFQFSSSDSPKILFPAIAGVKFGHIGHFIPILGMKGEQYIIGDPLKGRELYTEEKLLKKYKFTGFFMTIQKN